MKLGKFPLLPRRRNTDKRSYGHLLVLAGSKTLPGAAALTCRAALCSGAGLVTFGTPDVLVPFFAKKLIPEVMYLGLPSTKAGSLGPGAAKILKEFMKRRNISVLAVGPGLSSSPETMGVVREVVCDRSVALVLDADGLNSFRGKADHLRKNTVPLILTPHAGEFERVFGMAVPKERPDKIRLAKKMALDYHVVLVLKGPRTLVTDGKHMYENNTGGPAMAKGGAGDVLTGIIAAFVAQGLPPFLAAVWAVHVHGRAGDLAAAQKSELGVLASDLIEFLPRVFLKLR